MKFGQRRIPGALYYVVALYLLFCALYTPNFLLTIPIVIFPLLIFKLFWIEKQPNVLFWGMILQWTLPATQLLYCNFLGISLAEKMKETPLYSTTVELATLLSIIGIFAFSFGLYFAVRHTKTKADGSFLTYSPQRLLVLYVSITLIMILTKSVIWIFPGFVQFIFVFYYIKWGFFLVTFYVIHKVAPLLTLNFYGFLFFEFVLGLSSFFAGEIISLIMFAGVALVHLQPRLNVRTAIFGGASFLVLVYFLIVWSAVKKDYRAFVSRGQITQSVQVSPEEAREKLFSLVEKVDAKQFQDGLEFFVNRVGYIHFFAACLNYVPVHKPYENGEVYLSAIQHFLIPRFLNPGKKVLDDSEHTSKYTGITLSGRKEGTSFSLGYITDAYVDFGPIWMHVLLFGMGFLFGKFYNVIVAGCPNQFWVWIMTGPFIILLNINGADTKKALGAIFIYMVVMIVIRKSLIRFVESYLRPSNRVG